MKNFTILISLLSLSILHLSWYPFVIKKSVKGKMLIGPVKTVIERSWNWLDGCIVVQDYNKSGFLCEARFFYNKSFFDSIAFNLDREMFKESSIFLDSSCFYIPDEYSGLDTLYAVFSHKVTFCYNKKGKIKEKIGTGKNHNIYYRYIYTYNSKDSLKSIVYYSYDTLGNEQVTRKTKYKYKVRPNHIITKEIGMNYFMEHNYYYNNDTLLKKTIYSSGQYTGYGDMIYEVKYKRTENQFICSYYDYCPDLDSETITSKVINTFNKNGQLISIKTFSYLSDTIYETVIEDYCLVNNSLKSSIKTEIRMLSKDTLVSEFHYDKFGNEILRNGKYNSKKKTVEYEYDEYNNWTKNKVYYNYVFYDSVYRRIIYY